MKAIIGRKMGMTEVFAEDGTMYAVTVVEVLPNIVTQVKTLEKDGYVAVQVGYEDLKESRANKCEKGIAKKANTVPHQFSKELKGDGPYNIELFAGGPADPNAPNFFKGAMEKLQPEIDAGNIVVVSGQTEFTKCATEDWDNGKAQKRMESLLAGHYSEKDIHGVLSPNDGIARAILTACEDAGQPVPVVTGLDAENESVKLVWEGRQYCTVAKPTSDLVSKTVEIIDNLQKGDGMPEADTSAYNGKTEVPVYELPPVVVTKANAKEVFADDPERMKLLK